MSVAARKLFVSHFLSIHFRHQFVLLRSETGFQEGNLIPPMENKGSAEKMENNNTVVGEEESLVFSYRHIETRSFHIDNVECCSFVANLTLINSSDYIRRMMEWLVHDKLETKGKEMTVERSRVLQRLGRSYQGR